MNDPKDQVKAIFLEAIERHTSQEWPAFLEQACAGDADLRAGVEKLLSAQAEIGSFHEAARPMAPTIDPTPGECLGAMLGPYKLLQQIGEGGMGIVFMAEQTEPVRRRVAVKVIKPGMDSRQVIARFEAERQALALMDHINIARVLDAGATEAGRPYFVMELVHGVPITKYCDDNHLSPRQRLELFLPVCQAIHHAHQKGIIHRDLKPSNVMVTLYDGKPVAKVIDFGVAKATEQKLTERTLFTQYGTLVGTFEYMSPEQAEMSALGVDTRSDIYSLGVMLYELLTGSTPLTHKHATEAAYAEILRMIKEEEPPKPSTRLSDSGEALASISAQRKMDPVKLARLVRGELDWIVMKCLEKDRNRRYESASAFALDVQRYLADESVLACPPSRAYRLRKFARRNKATLATATLLAAAMIAGIMGTTWQAIRAMHEAERATHEANQAKAARADETQQRMIATRETQAAVDARNVARTKEQEAVAALKEVELLGALDKAARARELFNRNEGTAEQKLADRLQAARLLNELVIAQPSDVRHRYTLAETYHSIGVLQTELKQFDEAEKSLGAALKLRQDLLQELDDRTQAWLAALFTRAAIGQLYLKSNRPQDAHRLWQDMLAQCRQATMDRPQDAKLQNGIVGIEWTICQRYGEMGLWDLALHPVNESLRTGQLLNPEWDCRGAHMLAAAGRLEEHHRFCQLLADKWGKNNAALVILAATMNPDPGPEIRQLLELADRVIASDADSMSKFQAATAYFRAGEYARALELMLPFREKIFTGGSAYLHWYAMVYHKLGQEEEARRYFEQAEEKYLVFANNCLRSPGTSAVHDGHGGYWWAWAEDQGSRRAAWTELRGPGSLHDPWQHLIQARGYRLIGEIEKADGELAAAVAAAPDNPAVWMVLARLLAEGDDQKRSAESDWQKAVDLARDNPLPWIHRGRWYAAQREQDKADADFAQAFQLDPDHFLCRLERAKQNRTVIDAWDFSNGSTGLTGNDHCKLSVANGVLTIDATGKDPILVTPRFKTGPGRKQLTVYASFRGTLKSQVFWETTEGGASDDKSVWSEMDGGDDGAWHEYHVYFEPHPDIAGLRFYPPSKAGAHMQLAWITLAEYAENKSPSN